MTIKNNTLRQTW